MVSNYDRMFIDIFRRAAIFEKPKLNNVVNSILL